MLPKPTNELAILASILVVGWPISWIQQTIPLVDDFSGPTSSRYVDLLRDLSSLCKSAISLTLMLDELPKRWPPSPLLPTLYSEGGSSSSSRARTDSCSSTSIRPRSTSLSSLPSSNSRSSLPCNSPVLPSADPGEALSTPASPETSFSDLRRRDSSVFMVAGVSYRCPALQSYSETKASRRSYSDSFVISNNLLESQEASKSCIVQPRRNDEYCSSLTHQASGLLQASSLDADDVAIGTYKGLLNEHGLAWGYAATATWSGIETRPEKIENGRRFFSDSTLYSCCLQGRHSIGLCGKKPSPRKFAEFGREYYAGKIDVSGPVAQPTDVPSLEQVPDATPFFREPLDCGCPPWEPRRLRSLYRMRPFDLAGSRVAQLSSRLEQCRRAWDCSQATITLVDETDMFDLLEDGFCKMHLLRRAKSMASHTILNRNNGVTIRNAQADWRFRRNGSGLRGMGFYASVPITSPDGMPLGTVSLFDGKTRPDKDEIFPMNMLRDVAREAGALLEDHYRRHWGTKIARLADSFSEVLRAIKDVRYEKPRRSRDMTISSPADQDNDHGVKDELHQRKGLRVSFDAAKALDDVMRIAAVALGMDNVYLAAVELGDKPIVIGDGLDPVPYLVESNFDATNKSDSTPFTLSEGNGEPACVTLASYPTRREGEKLDDVKHRFVYVCPSDRSGQTGGPEDKHAKRETYLVIQNRTEPFYSSPQCQGRNEGSESSGVDYFQLADPSSGRRSSNFRPKPNPFCSGEGRSKEFWAGLVVPFARLSESEREHDACLESSTWTPQCAGATTEKADSVQDRKPAVAFVIGAWSTSPKRVIGYEDVRYLQGLGPLLFNLLADMRRDVEPVATRPFGVNEATLSTVQRASGAEKEPRDSDQSLGSASRTSSGPSSTARDERHSGSSTAPSASGQQSSYFASRRSSGSDRSSQRSDGGRWSDAHEKESSPNLSTSESSSSPLCSRNTLQREPVLGDEEEEIEEMQEIEGDWEHSQRYEEAEREMAHADREGGALGISFPCPPLPPSQPSEQRQPRTSARGPRTVATLPLQRPPRQQQRIAEQFHCLQEGQDDDTIAGWMQHEDITLTKEADRDHRRQESSLVLSEVMRAEDIASSSTPSRHLSNPGWNRRWTFGEPRPHIETLTAQDINGLPHAGEYIGHRSPEDQLPGSPPATRSSSGSSLQTDASESLRNDPIFSMNFNRLLNHGDVGTQVDEQTADIPISIGSPCSPPASPSSDPIPSMTAQDETALSFLDMNSSPSSAFSTLSSDQASSYGPSAHSCSDEQRHAAEEDTTAPTTTQTSFLHLLPSPSRQRATSSSSSPPCSPKSPYPSSPSSSSPSSLNDSWYTAPPS